MTPLCGCGRRHINMNYKSCWECRSEHEREVRLHRPLCECGKRRPSLGRALCSDCRQNERRKFPCAMCGIASVGDLCRTCNGATRRATRRHRVVVRLRVKGLTFRSIGEHLGVSRQRAEQIYRWTKSRARRALHKALKAGRVTKPAFCERCESETPRLDGHHEDYGKPLDVIWVCVPCHNVVHPRKWERVGVDGS